MTYQYDYSLSPEFVAEIAQNGLQAVPEMLRVLLNNLMQAERTKYLHADEYERTAKRQGHPNRNNPDYIVAACHFCNTADNRYFDLAKQRGLKFDGLTPDELVAQRLPYVLETRRKYREYWETVVLKHEPKES